MSKVKCSEVQFFSIHILCLISLLCFYLLIIHNTFLKLGDQSCEFSSVSPLLFASQMFYSRSCTVMNNITHVQKLSIPSWWCSQF